MREKGKQDIDDLIIGDLKRANDSKVINDIIKKFSRKHLDRQDKGLQERILFLIKKARDKGIKLKQKKVLMLVQIIYISGICSQGYIAIKKHITKPSPDQILMVKQGIIPPVNPSQKPITVEQFIQSCQIIYTIMKQMCPTLCMYMERIKLKHFVKEIKDNPDLLNEIIEQLAADLGIDE